MLKYKRKGSAFEIKTFEDDNKHQYLVFRYPNQNNDYSYHIFVEVEAKQIAKLLGIEGGHNTSDMWNKLWEEN